MLSLTQPGNFVYFLTYALAGLVPPFSSFFLVLLEHCGLQLQHLSPHSIMLVVIFTHFREIFVGVRPLVRLFWWFHVLRPVNRRPSRLGGYYFQHRTKGSSKYLAALGLVRWERWREDRVLVQAVTHEQLTLSTAAPTAPCVNWERDLGLEPAYNAVLGRIRILDESRLTSMMVLHDYVWARHKKCETCWAMLSPHLYRLASAPSGPGSQLRKSALSSRCLTLLAPRCQSWKMSSPAG
jgi:hypothetical protein